MSEKVCARCKVLKPYSAYYSRFKDRFVPFAYCRACAAAKRKDERRLQGVQPRELAMVGAVIQPADPVTQAKVFAEALEGKTYLYRSEFGALHMRRREAKAPRWSLVGVYDLGCDWRSVAQDLAA